MPRLLNSLLHEAHGVGDDLLGQVKLNLLALNPFFLLVDFHGEEVHHVVDGLQLGILIIEHVLLVLHLIELVVVRVDLVKVFLSCKVDVMLKALYLTVFGVDDLGCLTFLLLDLLLNTFLHLSTVLNRILQVGQLVLEVIQLSRVLVYYSLLLCDPLFEVLVLLIVDEELHLFGLLESNSGLLKPLFLVSTHISRSHSTLLGQRSLIRCLLGLVQHDLCDFLIAFFILFGCLNLTWLTRPHL